MQDRRARRNIVFWIRGLDNGHGLHDRNIDFMDLGSRRIIGQLHFQGDHGRGGRGRVEVEMLDTDATAYVRIVRVPINGLAA